MEARRLRNRKKQVSNTTPTPAAGALSPIPVLDAPTPTPHTATQERSDPAAAVSPAKLAANRSNSQHSTGPRTEEGKSISSRNNTRHGLTGDFSLLPDEDYGQFQILIESLTAEHKPKTTTETLLVWDMAKHHWLTQRALRFQNEAMFLAVDHQKLSLYLRYQTTQQRAFHRCLNDLLKLQKQRKSEDRGFESHRALGARCARCEMESQRLAAAREQRAQARENRQIEFQNERLLTEKARRQAIIERTERRKPQAAAA
jgi:hypothetical protein